MCDAYSWLPPLCEMEQYGGDWPSYESELYRLFREDWDRLRPFCRGQPVGYAVDPVVNGRPEAFWHLIQEKDRESGERVPNMRRCERIRWPRALIVESSRHDVCLWRERRRKGTRLVFALDDFSYVVILAERGGGKLFLVTAFPVPSYRRPKFRRQFERESGP